MSQEQVAKKRPIVVCLSGNQRSRLDYEAACTRETLAGRVVLTHGWYGASKDEAPDAKLKAELDELQKRRIDMADQVLVIAPRGLINMDSAGDITYAKNAGKTVVFFDPPPRKRS